MSLIDFKTRQTLRLYAPNTVMAFAMSSTVFIVSMQTSAILTIWFLDPTKLANSIPQWIQLTPQVNPVFYISLVFAIVTTAAVTYMLYRMHKNAKQIVKENIKKEVLDKHEKQTISYCDKEDAQEQEDEHYITLGKKYDGCILKSPSGKREAVLIPDQKEDGSEESQHRYKVVQYNNYEKSEITIKDFKEDFFKGEPSRDNVTIYTTNPFKLMNTLLLSQPRRKTQEQSK